MSLQSAMEPARYWMWTKRKLGGRPHVQSLMPLAAASSYNDSWEEQAFAEDSSGHLGGCIWPPRSYSCSFCSREFRSAQALGGHMNVHRRDRARLRQSSISQSENNPHLQHPNPSTPLSAQYPPDQVCSVVYSQNPNPKHGVVASSLSPSRVSAVSNQEDCTEPTLATPSYSSSVVKERCKVSLFSSPRFLSDSFPLQMLSIPELKLGRQSLKLREIGYPGKRDSDEEESISSKRRRIDESLPLFLRHLSGNRENLQSEVLGISPNPVEELDLELRL